MPNANTRCFENTRRRGRLAFPGGVMLGDMKIKLALIALVLCAGFGLAVSQRPAPPVWSLYLDNRTYEGTLTVPRGVVSVVDCSSAVRVQVPVGRMTSLTLYGDHLSHPTYDQPADYCTGKTEAVISLDERRSVNGLWEGQAVMLTSSGIVFDFSKARGPITVKRVR